MKKSISILACTIVLGFGTVFSQAWAQAKTAKACTAEWRADKAGFQAKGITERAYVADCRAGSAPGSAPAPTAAAPAPRRMAPAPAAGNNEGQKTARLAQRNGELTKLASRLRG